MDNVEAVTIREIRIIKQKPGAHHWENRKVLGVCKDAVNDCEPRS